MDFDVDIAVVGGGPAGSTAATMLARKGWRVLLLEREHFPREHIGESLLPASIPVLEELGVLPAVQAAGFVEKWGATMVWGAGGEPWSWYFRETNRRYPHSYQVWRPQFDKLLLDNARAQGVDVREGHTVTEVLGEGLQFRSAEAVGGTVPPGAAGDQPRTSALSPLPALGDGGRGGEGILPRCTGLRYTSDAGTSGTVTARFVVDASGQGAILGRSLRVRQWDDYFQNLAVYAYFEGARRLPQPDQGNIFIESYPNGWFWNIPLHTGWMSSGAVVDRRVGQEGIRRLGPEGFLREQIETAPHTRAMLSNARLIHGPVVLRDWSYVSDAVAGDGWILAGDSACFVDPLFSSGVHLALTAGVLAAAYVTTAIKRPEMRAASAQVYKDLYYKQYGHFREMAKLFYATNHTIESYFWEARRILGDDGRTPREAFIRAVAGQSPLGYERAVLERGGLPEEIRESVAAVENERTERRAHLEMLSAPGPDGDSALHHLVFRLAPGVRVEHKPVLDEGEFVPGQVLVTAGYPEGTPCSPLVAALVESVDGQTPVYEVIARLSRGMEMERAARLARAARTAIGILFVDGALLPADDEG